MKRNLLMLVLVWLAFSAAHNAVSEPSTSPDPAPIEALLSRADEMLDAGRWVGSNDDNALAAYRAVLALDSGNQRARAGLLKLLDELRQSAIEHLEGGRLQESLVLIEWGLEIQPDNLELDTLQRDLKSHFDQAKLEQQRKLKSIAAENVRTNLDSPLWVRLDQGALSADISDQPVAEVMTAIDALMPAGCAIGGYVFSNSDATVSVSFESLPLRDGLRRVLTGNDYLLDCDDERMHGVSLEFLDGATRPTRLANGSRSTRTAGESVADGSEELLERIHDLFEREATDELIGELEVAFNHPDRDVRLEALSLLVAVDGSEAEALLERIALDHDDPELRAEALELIEAEQYTDSRQLATTDEEER